ncbi:MAG: hypothetical protein ACLGIP_16770 [Alphaproteobacteria bacterium]
MKLLYTTAALALLAFPVMAETKIVQGCEVIPAEGGNCGVGQGNGGGNGTDDEGHGND